MSKYFIWVLLGILSTFLVAFFTYKLTYFSGTIFDEEYYVEASSYIFKGYIDPNFVHPPLAKWLISLPMFLLGDTWSLSWRIMPVTFGLLGLLVFYFLAKKIGFSRGQACIAVLALVGTRSYYTISRTAMLDIFLVFFVLLSGFTLYIYLEKRRFVRTVQDYTFDRWYILSAIFLGLAACCKWTGFFPLLFWFFYGLFYMSGPFKFKGRLFLYYGVIVALVYLVLSLALLHFDFAEFMFRNYISVVFHNSAMLPENDHVHAVDGGGMALVRFFTRYDQFVIKTPFYQKYGLSNNYFMPLYFLVFTFIMVLSGLGFLIRRLQKVAIAVPRIFMDYRIQFMYWYSFFLIMTWGLIPREQYLYYYLPAFPFIILFMGRYLLLFCSRKIQLLAVISYFCFFFYQFQLILPLY
jgi:dolichyl-phosphate-mannose--protein O-mannosyl transferase